MKIFVTRKIPEPGLEILRKKHEVVVFLHDRIPTKEEIIEGLKDKDGLLCLLSDPIDSDVINSEPKLKVIASYAVGYDNIDVKAATQKDLFIKATSIAISKAWRAL